MILFRFSRVLCGSVYWVLCVGLLAGEVLFGVPLVAVDAEPDPDLVGWHISEYGYDRLHARGVTGAGTNIAIAESGFDSSSPDLAGADIEYIRLPKECEPIAPEYEAKEIDIQHGTDVATMIVGQGGPGKIQGVAPRAKLLVYQLPRGDVRPGKPSWPPECDGSRMSQAGVAMQAEADGADIFSLSVLGGREPDYLVSAFWAMRNKAIFIGAGNTRGIVMSVGATTLGIAGVAAVGPRGGLLDWASYGADISVAAPGTDLPGRNITTGKLERYEGSSLSAPIAAGTLALGRQAHPEATTHQLTQSMIRNTREGKGTVTHNSTTGFGVMDPVAFIDADPKQYPDEPAFTHKQDPRQQDWNEFVDDVLTGAKSRSLLGYHPGYKENAGIDPALIKWLPEK